MANCITTIKRVTFDVSDPQITKVEVDIDFEGDCGILVKRHYEKTFPARLSMIDILQMPEGEGGIVDYLLW